MGILKLILSFFIINILFILFTIIINLILYFFLMQNIYIFLYVFYIRFRLYVKLTIKSSWEHRFIAKSPTLSSDQPVQYLRGWPLKLTAGTVSSLPRLSKS